ncbi:MAG: hypothetical protein ABIP34_12695 [Rhodoferax sp.]|uniref:antitoxin n=1 Tax=Rhodoferax sp. TaxID=50421 RepID=UPI0032665066
MPAIAPNDPASRHVRLFRNGANQAVRIPRGFELPGKEALMQQVGNTLVITPVPEEKTSLAALLASWDAMDFDMPNADEGLLPLDDIAL